MDASGEPADAGGPVDPSAVFFGLWPKSATSVAAGERSDAAAREPRVIAHEVPRPLRA